MTFMPYTIISLVSHNVKMNTHVGKPEQILTNANCILIHFSVAVIISHLAIQY